MTSAAFVSSPSLLSTRAQAAAQAREGEMLVKGGEGILGKSWGFKKRKLLVNTFSGKETVLEIESVVEMLFLPTSFLEAWLQ